jgi:cyclase
MSSFKRIIFCLYYQDDYFYLSRNFRLQKVGDLEWLIKNFGFGQTANYIDELVVLLVKKNPSKEDFNNFLTTLDNLRKKIFIPLVLGGNIRNIDTVNNYFKFGADKILVNSSAYDNKNLIQKISDSYGSQSISTMIDYKKSDNKINLYSNNGMKLENISFKNHISNLNNLNCGEIILNSMDNDGNGAGLDDLIINEIPNNIKKPILLMGGAGKPEHIYFSLQNKKIFGIVTANLFNFLGTGLKESRNLCVKKKIKLAYFEQLK